MKKWTVPALALVLLTMLAANAYSQLGIYLGGYGGVSAQKPSFENVQFDTTTTFLYGLHAGIKFLMFAAELNYFTADHNIKMEDYFLFNWDGKTNSYSYIGLNLRYIFALAMLHPYLTAGYGYYTADIQNINKDTEGGWNFGAGLEIMLGNKFSILAEGKYHKVTVDITSIKLGLGDFTFCAGLNVYF